MAATSINMSIGLDGVPQVVQGLQNVETASGRIASGMDQVEAAANKTGGGVISASGRMASAIGSIQSVIMGVVSAWGSWQILKAGQEATMFAANVEQADRALSVIANTMGKTSEWAMKYRDGLRDLNITTNSATNATAQFIKAGFPMEALNKLGTAAQGAAISYAMMTGETISSSQALDKMIRALMTGNVTELHTLGINVMMRDALRANTQATGEAALQVDSHERKLLMLNDVLKQTEPLMQLYSKSTDLAAKQISSSKRPIEELTVALGQLFLPILTELATAFYKTVVNGMQWVSQHKSELEMTQRVISELARGLVFAATAFIIYSTACGVASLATGGFAAITATLRGGMALLRTQMTLTGAEIVTVGAASRVAMIETNAMGEAMLVMGTKAGIATKTASIGLMSVKTALAVVAAAFIGWEIGTLLSNNFEGARKLGVAIVAFFTGLWEGLRAVGNMQVAIFQAIFTGDIGKIKKAWDDSGKALTDYKNNIKGLWKDTEKAPVAVIKPGYQNDPLAMKNGQKRQEEQDLETARIKREQKAMEEQALAEKQAQYNKQVSDAEFAYKDELAKQERILLNNQVKEEIEALKFKTEQGIITERQYYDRKHVLQQQALQTEIEAQKSIVMEREASLARMENDPGVDRLMQVQEELKVLKEKGRLTELQTKLENDVTQQVRDRVKVEENETKLVLSKKQATLSAMQESAKMATALDASADEVKSLNNAIVRQAYETKRLELQQQINEARKVDNNDLVSITSTMQTQLSLLYSESSINDEKMDKLRTILGLEQGVTAEKGKQAEFGGGKIVKDADGNDLTASQTWDSTNSDDRTLLNQLMANMKTVMGSGLDGGYGMSLWKQYLAEGNRLTELANQKALAAQIEANKKIVEAMTTAAGDLSSSATDLSKSGLSLAESLRSAASKITDTQISLATSGTSTLSPEQQYALARQTFLNTAAQAQATGDVDLYNQLPQLAQQLLQLSQSYNGSGAGFTTDYNTIQAILAESAARAGTQATAAEQTVSLLQKQADLLEAIKTALSNGGDITGLLGQLKTVNNAINTSVGTVNTSVGATTAAAIATNNSTGQVVANIANNNTLTSSGTNTLAGWLSAVNSNNAATVTYTNATQSVLASSLLASQLQGRVKSVSTRAAAGGSTANNSDQTYTYYKYGGIADDPSGQSIFGEAGPEAAVPLPDGRTIPVTLYGRSDNYRELVDEMRALRDEIRAGNRIKQAGFNETLKTLKRQEKNSETVANKMKLAGAA